MFKSLNTIVVALIAGMVLATGAQAAGPIATTSAKATGPTATTGAKATDPTAATASTRPEDIEKDIGKAIKNYRQARSDYARDMVHLHRADEGNYLSRSRGPYLNKVPDEVWKTKYTNEVMFNTVRAPLETLRDEGISIELNSVATRAGWAFSARTPQDFRNKFGAPAYTASLGTGYCYPEVSAYTQALMSADMEYDTYIDVDKDGKALEIYVTTCKVLDGYAKGTSLIQSISPVMTSMSFINKFADKEKKVMRQRD